MRSTETSSAGAKTFKPNRSSGQSSFHRREVGGDGTQNGSPPCQRAQLQNAQARASQSSNVQPSLARRASFASQNKFEMRASDPHKPGELTTTRSAAIVCPPLRERLCGRQIFLGERPLFMAGNLSEDWQRGVDRAEVWWVECGRCSTDYGGGSAATTILPSSRAFRIRSVLMRRMRAFV